MTRFSGSMQIGGASRGQVSAALSRQLILSNARGAIANNPRTRAAMAAPPTITVGTTAPGSTIIYPATPAAAADFMPVIRHYGGWRVYDNGAKAIYSRAATVNAAAAIDRTGLTNSAGTQNFAEFITDAPIFSIRVVAAAITTNLLTVKLIVDGQYVSLSGHSLLTGSFTNNYIQLDFTSAGGRTFRRIGIETADQNAIGGVYTSAIDTVFAPAEEEVPPIVVLTDSYGVGTGASAAVDSFAAQLRHYLGWPNVVVNATGGTGILARIGGNSNNALDRVNAGDIATLNPAAVIMAMGVNDASQINATTITRAAFQAQIPLTLAAVRAAAPNAALAVVGPWTPPSTNQTILGQVDDDIAAGVAAFADPRTFNIRSYRRYGYNYPTSQIVKPVLWGTGYSGAPSGSGPNDSYIGTDQVHALTGGHNALARWVASEFIAGLAAIAA